MGSSVKRSEERLVFYFKTQDTPTTVQRKTVKKAASALGLDETSFLHLAAAQLVGKLKQAPKRAKATEASGNDDGHYGRLTDAQIEAIRAIEPQDFTPTRSFVDMLDR
jgi:hypothetical protein